MILLSTMMLPGAVRMIPTYILFAKLDWVGTFKPLTVPALTGSAFSIFMLRQFLATLPGELEEAARIDGAGTLRTYFTIDDLNQAIMVNPRNCYQNYNVGINDSDRTIYTYMGALEPRRQNATYCSAGQLSPLLNDPFHARPLQRERHDGLPEGCQIAYDDVKAQYRDGCN